MQERLGEVIEAKTGEFRAESYDPDLAPAFGSWVKTSATVSGVEYVMYGVVAEVETGSLDPGRRPMALGRDFATREELYREQPQLKHLLRTDFRSLVVGYRAQEQVWHRLPPTPPPLHGFVYPCGREEVAAFTLGLGFLPLLMGAPGLAVADELIAASLHRASTAHPDPRAFLVQAGRELALQLGGEPHRLRSLLMRMRP